jgi:hypothetical protein
MYTSTSGSGSLALFLLSCTSSLYWDTTFCIASPSMPMYSMNVRAVVLLGEYVRMMTEHSTRSVSLLRSDDIERRARRVKRVSNWATARSRRTKLPRMSTVVGSARWYRYLHEATSVAIRWLGHILRTGHAVVQLVQGHLEVKGMLRGGVGYIPAIAFCSTFSVLGCSPAVTTPSMLSAMMVALGVYAGRREGAGVVEGRRGGRDRLLVLVRLSSASLTPARNIGETASPERPLFTPASPQHTL